MIRPRQLGSIRISTQAQNDSLFEKYLLHELVHPILEPIREEHQFQMQALPTERTKEYIERHTREVEKAVEHLCNVLYTLESNMGS